MNKQLLTFASLSLLALGRPVAGLMAAPAPGSTEQADRQFLSNLENSDAAKSAPAPAAISDVENQASQERPVQAKTSSPAKKKTEVAKSSDREAAPQSPSRDVLRNESPQAAATTKKRASYAKSAARERAVQTSDAVETEAAKHAGRERTSQPQEVAEGEALQTAPIKKTKDHITYSVHERTVQPADSADPAPIEPIQSKSKTVTIVRSTDRDHDHIQDEDRGFFHRLFHHELSQHPEDW